MGGAAVPLLDAGERDAVSWVSYLLRYWTARTLWNAAHQSQRPRRAAAYRWEAGDELWLHGRGHFRVGRDARGHLRWEQVTAPPEPR